MQYAIPADCSYDNPVLFYAGEFGYFMSNFSAFMVEWEGLLWPTSEHAYQAAKFPNRDMQARICSAHSAHEALKRAEVYDFQGHLRPDWNEVKIPTMESIVRAKLQQHEYIERKLLETGDRPLVENSDRDAFWGRGPDWQGRNELGQIWMRLREELRTNGSV